MYALSNADIKLLQVFLTVVEFKGFSSAQIALNISQPTISNQMSRLETRLGFKLCERGRSGFKLTPDGEQVYHEAKDLFRAHERFQNLTSSIKGSLSGALRIAVIDNVISDDNCPISEALRLYNERSRDTTISLKVLRSDEMERALIGRHMDIAIGVFPNRIPMLKYQRIYDERNELMCGDMHPAFNLENESDILETTFSSRKTTRALLGGSDINMIKENLRQDNAIVHDVEATALLILSGVYIGFLPKHFARQWVDKGRMKAILPTKYYFDSQFSVVTREKTRSSLILTKFYDDLKTAIAKCKSTQDI